MEKTSKESAKNNIIEDWLKEHGDPEVDKEVECKLEQITLEEAAENYAVQYLIEDEQEIDSVNRKQSFKAGAKWQAKRMYSEEEVIEFAEWIRNNPMIWRYSNKLNDCRTTKELFEQFKK